MAFQGIQGMKHRCTFFMLGISRCGLHKKRVRTHYAELVFLHLVGLVGHILHSGASEARNVDTLFLILGWDKCCFYKKCAGTE
jgi:hypothetical protein